MYTLAAPESERERRRLEDLSDTSDHIEYSRSLGHRPVEIAFQLAIRLVWGAKDDVAWSVPHLPKSLMERLEKGSEAISRTVTPKWMIPSLAMLGLVNSSYLASEVERSPMELLMINGAVVAVIVVMHNQQRTWARRVIRLYLILAALMMVSALTLVVFHYGLHQEPGFHRLAFQFLLQLSAATLPVLLAISVASKLCRDRFFKGHWWPVFIGWGAIATVSLSITILIGGSLSVLPMVWGVAILSLILLIAAIWTFALMASGVWYGGLKLLAGGMRIASVGIRHLL